MEILTLTVLSQDEVDRLLSGLSAATFVDGKATAKGAAAEVKRNLQLDRGASDWSALDDLIFAALRRNRHFQSFAYPKRVLSPTYSRYEPGMHYGQHIDSAVMGAQPMRTDLSVTIFLSPPASYEGGELAIQSSLGEEEVKLAPGEAVVYPSTSLHRVKPVTRGVRMAAVTWVQCSVRDERLRSILYDLNVALEKAEAIPKADGASGLELFQVLNKSYHNLMRYAVDL